MPVSQFDTVLGVTFIAFAVSDCDMFALMRAAARLIFIFLAMFLFLLCVHIKLNLI